ncbi:heat-inducible transcriptional repressor HrcA [endosymbiont of unidentified scaly snail isolate Monju]|uniref:heat-inducible transcriptional repressor HrcA n=1 Tax=endosymbiont of unidentified scaly snail isolate Monju TaxID=1248727 RepID=UPI000389220F|nr:heat-inducible transcriptional repressor HrcA [endosymbiont of unidentified scaly snail isolate Monju]BAN68999.1 heat-inducible transcriptional repressor [endosymbiont of unidentified scaly snail isolate Monju]
MVSRAPAEQISERAQHFLKVLIERYIRDGQPVGSRTLARDSGLDLSPATIRNVMADLEELGLVASPHTSAGRVPTAAGYRLFVDSLLSIKPLNRKTVDQLQQQLPSANTPGEIVESASRLLSSMTRLAGVVMVPKRNQERVRQIEFVPLSGTRVLAVLVTSAGEILNRIIETGRRFERSELEQLSNYITEHYAGHDLESVRRLVLDDMQATRERMDDLMAEALRMAQVTFSTDAEDEADVVVSGQTNLMDFDELARMDRLRELFEVFAEKQQMLHLLDRCLEVDGVQIYIGEESGYETLRDCSIITSPYKVDDEVVGVLGVIGPTRLPYDKVIPIVDVTAQLLGAALKFRS